MWNEEDREMSDWTDPEDAKPEPGDMVLGVKSMRGRYPDGSTRESWAWGLWTWTGAGWIPPWPIDGENPEAYMKHAPDFWRALPDAPARGNRDCA
jgi:hypothetical protein